MGRDGRIALLLAAALAAAPLAAQDVPDRPLPELEERADRDDEAETPEEEADALAARPRPWTLAPWIPLNWRSNLALTPNRLRSGLSFEPEVKLLRRWSLGDVALLTEANTALSAVPSDAVRSSTSWWLLAEASAGRAADGPAPYASYEPLTLHDGVFGSRILTFHTFTAGIRRQWGPTSLNLFLRRRDSTIDALDRTVAAAQLSHTAPVGRDLAFNIRTDAEYRRYDQGAGPRREDLFVRARARLFIPIAPRADLVLNADIQRNRSSSAATTTTQIVLGPVLSASFGL